MMNELRPIVFIVDDEPSVCVALGRLISSIGVEVRTFNFAAEFLAAERPDVPGCLILDVRLPDMSGLDLQAELVKANIDLPIVFLTGHGDISMSVRAMKAGAAEFLTKPCKDQDLLDAIQRGIQQHRTIRDRRAEISALRRRYQLLTQRERDVFPLVVSGLLNKQIAARLGASEKTVKIHRSHVMRKMQADSLAGLVVQATKLGILPRSTN
jgi:FixJ family two-component response regulator